MPKRNTKNSEEERKHESQIITIEFDLIKLYYENNLWKVKFSKL